jgi:hypothetical protein
MAAEGPYRGHRLPLLPPVTVSAVIVANFLRGDKSALPLLTAGGCRCTVPPLTTPWVSMESAARTQGLAVRHSGSAVRRSGSARKGGA